MSKLKKKSVTKKVNNKILSKKIKIINEYTENIRISIFNLHVNK